MAGRDYLSLGDWNAYCSMCGRKRKASELVKNWQGMYRCPQHNEARHPQDFVRAVPDVQTPPWVQPAGTVFADIPDFIVTESYVASVDLFAAEVQYGIATESGTPLLTE